MPRSGCSDLGIKMSALAPIPPEFFESPPERNTEVPHPFRGFIAKWVGKQNSPPKCLAYP